MPQVEGPLAGAGTPRRRGEEDARPWGRRLGSLLVWWVVLMAFWVWIDDSVAVPELLVGALGAALGAVFVEQAQYQAATHIRLRAEWVAQAYRLPWQVARDTGVVLAALWRRVARGEQPPSGFRTVPVRWGDDTAEGVTRRALIVASTSVAPNTLSLGIDPQDDVMIVHHLVVSPPGCRKRASAGANHRDRSTTGRGGRR
jgi:multisubunit Na+/H+ antiporter MnhE subunit